MLLSVCHILWEMNLYGCFLTAAFCRGAVPHALAGLCCSSPPTLCIHLWALLSRHIALICQHLRAGRGDPKGSGKSTWACISSWALWVALEEPGWEAHAEAHLQSPSLGTPLLGYCQQLPTPGIQLVWRFRSQVMPWSVSEALVQMFWYTVLVQMKCHDYPLHGLRIILLPYVYMYMYVGMHQSSIQTCECFQICKYHGKINIWSRNHPSRPGLWFLQILKLPLESREVRQAKKVHIVQ